MSTTLIIGGGNMGGAIARAAVRDPAQSVLVTEPDADRRQGLAAIGCRAFAAAGEAVRACGPSPTIVLAVKPQMFDSLASELRASGVLPLPECLVVSIMAGVAAARIDAALASPGARIVRAMPNLPLTLGLGMTSLTRGPRAADADVRAAAELFPGETTEIEESLIDAFTALAASGPAYLFYFAEALQRAGVEVGFTPQQSATIVRQMIVGAAMMLREAGESPAELRARVTSKGGTTAAAISEFERAAFADAVARAVAAARDRGRELNSA